MVVVALLLILMRRLLSALFPDMREDYLDVSFSCQSLLY